MLEVMMVLTVLNAAVAVAALVMAIDSNTRRHGAMPPYKGEAEQDGEEKPFKLSDKKMQEGIANLLSYQPGAGGEDE